MYCIFLDATSYASCVVLTGLLYVTIWCPFLHFPLLCGKRWCWVLLSIKHHKNPQMLLGGWKLHKKGRGVGGSRVSGMVWGSLCCLFSWFALRVWIPWVFQVSWRSDLEGQWGMKRGFAREIRDILVSLITFWLKRTCSRSLSKNGL